MEQRQTSGTAAALCALNDYDKKTPTYKKVGKSLKRVDFILKAKIE